MWGCGDVGIQSGRHGATLPATGRIPAFVFYATSARFVKMAATSSSKPKRRLPPGRALNVVNQFVQYPVVGHVIEGVHWALLCLLAGLLSPFVLVYKLLRAAKDCLVYLGRIQVRRSTNADTAQVTHTF